MDLLRPANESEAQKIVQSVSGKEAEILKEDFYNSLRAAFTVQEIKQQLETADLKFEIEKFGSRHCLIKGVM
jgi:vacuolar-type H+-ATPase subunit C/Vma6